MSGAVDVVSLAIVRPDLLTALVHAVQHEAAVLVPAANGRAAGALLVALAELLMA